MDAVNAFIGKAEKPTDPDLAAALGASKPVWDRLVAELAEQEVDIQEWKCYSKKYGWSLLLKRRKRTILYLGPCQGCFRVSFVLGGKAVEAARAGRLSKKALQILAEAPKYPEGTGVRLIIKAPGDLALVRTLTAAKLAN